MFYDIMNKNVKKCISLLVFKSEEINHEDLIAYDWNVFVVIQSGQLSGNMYKMLDILF